MITLTYKKWEVAPVIVTFATKETPIYEIPFPAVTICPEQTVPINITALVQQDIGDADIEYWCKIVLKEKCHYFFVTSGTSLRSTLR